ncbi:MAG: hypothetical protein LBR20_07575, partial [Propionibacteriaceae bacterium]|nr:hypothetical protein [Propionibacteriaceae bacterium]
MVLARAVIILAGLFCFRWLLLGVGLLTGSKADPPAWPSDRLFPKLAGLVVPRVEWSGWPDEHQFGTGCRSAAGYHNPVIDDLHKTKQQ